MKQCLTYLNNRREVEGKKINKNNNIIIKNKKSYNKKKNDG